MCARLICIYNVLITECHALRPHDVKSSRDGHQFPVHVQQFAGTPSASSSLRAGPHTTSLVEQVTSALVRALVLTATEIRFISPAHTNERGTPRSRSDWNPSRPMNSRRSALLTLPAQVSERAFSRCQWQEERRRIHGREHQRSGVQKGIQRCARARAH